jgi:hypothetical protein
MAKFEEWDRYYRDDQQQDDFVPQDVPPPTDFGKVIDPEADPVPTDDAGGDDFGTFTPPAYAGPFRPSFNFPTPPTFNPRSFEAPSLDDAMNEPGYQFRLNSGTNALDRSAAARGVLRTGNTLKDIIEYGQNFGQQEYNNMFERALRAYQAYYQGERDKFLPLLQDYQNRFQAEQGAGMAGFDLWGDLYHLDWQGAQNQEDRILQATLAGGPEPDVSMSGMGFGF